MLLQARFKSYANGGSLQVTEFMKVIQEMYPEFTDGAAAGLFATFDTDHSGDVDVEVRSGVQPERGETSKRPTASRNSRLGSQG